MLLEDFKKMDQNCFDLLTSLLGVVWDSDVTHWNMAKSQAMVLADALEERGILLNRKNDLASWFRLRNKLGIFVHRERYGAPAVPALRVELFTQAGWTNCQQEQKKILAEEAERREYERLKAKFEVKK